MTAWYDGDGKRRHKPSDWLLTAARIRAEVHANDEPTDADLTLADKMEADVREPLQVAMSQIGPGGELVAATDDTLQTPPLRNTVLKPDAVTAEASRTRLELAERAGVLDLAVDAADTVNAGDSLERMLAHQMAAAHNVAMRLAGRAAMHTERATQTGRGPECEFHSIEAARTTNAMARAMSSFQEGASTLRKLRSGGHQTVTVQHVTVEEGGKAVVAGNVATGGRRKRKPKGEDD